MVVVDAVPLPFVGLDIYVDVEPEDGHDLEDGGDDEYYEYMQYTQELRHG